MAKIKNNKSVLVIIGIVIIVAAIIIAAIGASVLSSTSGTTDNNDNQSGDTTNGATNNYGMSILRAEKNDDAYSSQPNYDIYLRIWNNGTTSLILSIFDFDALGTDGVHYSVDYPSGKYWSSTSITSGHYTDLWISVTPNGDAGVKRITYQVTSSTSFYCTINQSSILDNTTGGIDDGDTTEDTSNKYGMSVLQIHKINTEYTGLCQIEMQVKIWNNDTKSIPMSTYYLKARTSLGEDSETNYLTRDSWTQFTLSPGSTATFWIKVEPGCGVGVTRLSYSSLDLTFGCDINPAMLAAATTPWSMSVLSVNYVHYSTQNPDLRACVLEVKFLNNDYTQLTMNLNGFIGYGTDSVRYDAYFVPSYAWNPFDIAPGKSTTVRIMFEVGSDVEIEHLVYYWVKHSPMECDVP